MTPDIRRTMRKMFPHLLKAQQDNLNEADTVLRIIKFFEEVLGYDPMSEISREQQIRDKYIDIIIKIDSITRLIVEVKAAGVALRDRHIEQAERYAAESNIPWVLLTNGIEWNLYHLSFEEGIEYSRVFSVMLSEETIDRDSASLSILHKQSIKNNDHEEYWKCRVALSPESIVKALFTEDVLQIIRRQIRKNEGLLIDTEDLANAIHEMFSAETREITGPVRIRRKKKVKVEQKDIENTQSQPIDSKKEFNSSTESPDKTIQPNPSVTLNEESNS